MNSFYKNNKLSILIIMLILLIILIIYLSKKNAIKYNNIVQNYKNYYFDDIILNEFNINKSNFKDYLKTVYGNYIINNNDLMVTQKSFLSFKDELILNNKFKFTNNKFTFILKFNIIEQIFNDNDIYNYIIIFNKLKLHFKIVFVDNKIKILYNDRLYLNNEPNIIVVKFEDNDIINNKIINFSLFIDNSNFTINKIIIKNYYLTDNEINILVNN